MQGQPLPTDPALKATTFIHNSPLDAALARIAKRAREIVETIPAGQGILSGAETDGSDAQDPFTVPPQK